MSKYQAILFASDGQFVTDYRDKTKEEVIDCLNNQGSRWYFYPFHAVIVYNGRAKYSRQTLVDVAEPFEFMKGKQVKTFQKFIASIPEDELIALMGY